MSKYEKRWEYIKNKNQNNLKLTFEEIKNILGFEIDHSFLNYKKELVEFGYEVKRVPMKEKFVEMVKIEK